MGRPARQYLWKSFADLAMGLMAVFVLVLVLLLWRQDELSTALEIEQAKTEADRDRVQSLLNEVIAERETLSAERGAFAIELVELFESTYDIVVSQDRAEEWLSTVFEEGPCQLRMSAKGELVVVAATGGTAAASLYDSGRFALSARGRKALLSCRDNFLKLAYCLAPADDVPSEVHTRRTQFCGAEAMSATAPASVLRSGIEALSLEGNTDRMPLGTGTPSIRAHGSKLVFEASAAESFVGNAYLGAERARQALGNLLSLVEAADEDEWDALQVLMSRLRIESPSYGRYQAGPLAWRTSGCEGQPHGCAAARNLSLKVRWKKQALRKPFDLVRQRICALLGQETSAFAKGLKSQGLRLAEGRARFGCPVEGP